MKFSRYFFSFIISFFSVGYCQFSFSGLLTTNYGQSKNDFNIQETLLDINGNWNNWTGWIQLEHSDPPELGRSLKGIRKFRLDYSSGDFTIKLGDMYEFWGRGLMVNMVDDQAIDLDTGVRGGLLNWTNDLIQIDLFGGIQNIWRSSNEVFGFNDRVPNYEVDHTLYGGRIAANYHQWHGAVQYMQVNEDHLLPRIDTIEKVGHQLIGVNIEYYGPATDFGFEYVKKDAKGFGFYGLINMYIGDWSIGTSYKNYHFADLSPDDRWDFVNIIGGALTLQQMPTLFEQHATRLLGRITHQIDYNDELGFDIRLKGPLFQNTIFSFSYASSSRHKEWYLDNNWNWIMGGSSGLLPSTKPVFNAFREMYAELEGYLLNGNLHYNIGTGLTNDVTDLYMNRYADSNRSYSYESLSATTLPAQFTYTINQRFSLELKYEYQKLKKGVNAYSELPTNMPSFTSNFLKDKQINRIISVGLGRSPLWSISLMMDYANTEERIIVDEVRNKNSIEEMLGNLWDTSLTWANIEISYNISSNHRLTVMYGSQRGGVLCSNGVCRYVQPFENGFKIGLIAVL